VGDIFGVIASVGVVASLLLSAWQTRELAHQTATSNGIAAASAMYNGIERMHHIDDLIFQRPETNACFYEGADLPTDELEKSRVLALARMLADTIDYGLMITALIPETDNYEGWRDFALRVRETSPALVQLVGAHEPWWPALVAHWNRHPSAA